MPLRTNEPMPNATKQKVQVHLYRLEEGTGEPLFLILRRTAAKNRIWQPVTGNVEEGESPEEAALRELSEETGICELCSCRRVGAFEFEKGNTRFYETVFVAETTKSDVTLCWEHEAHQWLPYERARELIHYESNKQGLDSAYREVKQS
ncbi:MAG: NUDIX pyrophosphatase [Candidatus Hydrogenedentota bacterium]|nr:MAG: NUDIX pyrophosphatase [Candidatus Hydrogenedentota bacterium]